jgi:hypothetical protein
MIETTTSRYRQLTGWGLIAAALTMFAGAMLLAAHGADPMVAWFDGDIDAYLADVEESSLLVQANLWTWIGGVWVYLAAGLAMGRLLPHDSWGRGLSRAGLTAGTAIVMVAYTGWLTIPLHIAPAWVASPSPELRTLGLAVAWWTYAADQIATIGVLSIGMGVGVISARSTWAPRWLVALGGAALVSGMLSMIPFVFSVAGWLAMPMIPIGLATTIGAGFSILRWNPARTPVLPGDGIPATDAMGPARGHDRARGH